ncbi:hypothetical protein Tco_0786117 [Tanacetum coccineum]
MVTTDNRHNDKGLDVNGTSHMNVLSKWAYTSMMIPRVRNHHGGRNVYSKFTQHVHLIEFKLEDLSSYIKVSESTQDMDIGLGEADSETSSKRSV